MEEDHSYTQKHFPGSDGGYYVPLLLLDIG